LQTFANFCPSFSFFLGKLARLVRKSAHSIYAPLPRVERPYKAADVQLAAFWLIKKPNLGRIMEYKLPGGYNKSVKEDGPFSKSSRLFDFLRTENLDSCILNPKELANSLRKAKRMKKPSFLTLALVLVLLIGPQASATTRSVPGDYPNIQAAINAAVPGDRVIVSPGTYNENINFNGKSITVTSTDPNNPAIVADTIIDAGGSGSVVTFANREGLSAVLTGFTVTGGYVTGGFPTGCGGGIQCIDAEPTITNCIIYGNTAHVGGGMYCESASPKVVSCTFSSNSAYSGGGMFVHASRYPTVLNSTFSGNSADTDGGGINVFYGYPIVLANCTFSNNTAKRGNGGGIYIVNSSSFSKSYPGCSIITNCTFSGNTANSGVGGGIYCSREGSLSNCILWGNSPQQMYVDVTGFLSAVYSNIQGGWAGEGNIKEDPLFVDAANGDYHLQVDSPCINAGDPDFVAEPGMNDIDGEPRIMGAAVDMGVDEYSDNIRPIADTGQDQSMSDMPGQVTLDGSSSSDSDSDPLSYHWSQTFGPEVEIDDANSAITTFSPAEYGGYIFELVVNDGFLDSFADSVNIVVGSGHIPVADAGLPRYAGTDPVELDGTGSYDPDNSGALSYQWQQISGPNLTITGADTPTPTISGFTPTDSIQRCEFELIVSDGQYESLPGTVFVIIVHNRYSESRFRLESGTFDPEKPTFINFGRGGSWNAGYNWESRANILSECCDSFDIPSLGDYLIVYLSRVAPNYKQPIQLVGCSGGSIPAIEVPGYMNSTYQDRRYAVNHVTNFDGSACMSDISRFLASRVDREQCWVDNYPDAAQNFLPCLTVKLPAAFGHCGGLRWYKNSLTYSDMNQFTSPVAGPGVVAGAYWSVIGPGRNLQLALTPYTETYRFKWDGSMWSGYMDFYNQSSYPGRLPEPVTLIEPADIESPGGLVLTCEESQNAVGYQLLIGRDPYRVMDFEIISDTPGPPTEVITEVPKGAKYWTIKVRDQWGSTIYADPLRLPWLLTVDLGTLAKYWLNSCSQPQWCDSCDINHSGLVDFIDFANFASHWYGEK